jgi:hypothetical protein
MTKEQYTKKLMELASKCRGFAEDACQQWRTEVPGTEIPEDVDEEDLGDKALYVALETLESQASFVLQRAASLLQGEE